jgi:hypothetical protein
MWTGSFARAPSSPNSKRQDNASRVGGAIAAEEPHSSPPGCVLVLLEGEMRVWVR